MPETRQSVEPYKLSEIFAIIPEYDGNPIFLNTFISSCNTAQTMAVDNQQLLIVLHIKNKLRGRAAELVNSRNPTTWADIKLLLENHFGDPRDLSSLINDLQRMRQLGNESPLTFGARLQTHLAKLIASINKQTLTQKEKQAQIDLIESMALNSLLTGLEPKIGQIIRASDPDDIVSAISRIKRELQLQGLEAQKNNSNYRTPVPPARKPNPPSFPKQCSFCKRMGHTVNECILRSRQYQPNSSNNQNFSSPRPNPPQHHPHQSHFQNQHFRQNSNFQAGPSSNQQRPNPNFYKQQPQRTHHLNNSDFNYYFDNQHNTNYSNSYESEFDYLEGHSNFNQYDNQFTDYYHTNQQSDLDCHNGASTFNQCIPNNHEYSDEYSSQNFLSPPLQTKPPDQHIADLQTQIQTLNLDSYNPNVNFPEQNFL